MMQLPLVTDNYVAVIVVVVAIVIVRVILVTVFNVVGVVPAT